MQSLLGGTPVASFMAWGETLSGKISRLSLSGLLFLLKIRMFIPFFCCYAKRFRTIFVSLHPLKEFRSKRQEKSYTEMNLNMHITSQSCVQSYRRFERNSYVHTSSTSDTAGIGFPHHYSHSYFYRVS